MDLQKLVQTMLDFSETSGDHHMLAAACITELMRVQNEVTNLRTENFFAAVKSEGLQIEINLLVLEQAKIPDIKADAIEYAGNAIARMNGVLNQEGIVKATKAFADRVRLSRENQPES